MNAPIRMRTIATTVLAALTLTLTGCFISPGQFTSELMIEDDASFTFNYEGEIFFLGLSELAKMSASAEEFEAQDCYTDDFEERECTQDELDAQRTEWDLGAEERAAKAEEEAAEMAAVLGGINPTDPEAAEELRQLLLRHKGWNKVETKGSGVFDVSYSASGNLSHNFMFPVIEGFPGGANFVEVILRDDNVIRINAPGFATQDEANPVAALMGGAMGFAALGSLGESGEGVPDIPQMAGTFRIVTSGNTNIRANNTDEGASALQGGEELVWEINSSTSSAPTALIKLGE